MQTTQTLILENRTAEGELLQATFMPEKGMNLISYKKGGLEIIDQSTWPLFEERFAGLGALIGPHFHRRRPEALAAIKDTSLFPHIARVRAHGTQDPFSHGIARYAPWKVEATQTRVTGVLSGKDTWNGVPLASLEGQNFNMIFSAELKESGLHLDLSIVSDSDSLVGIHYYYALPGGRGCIVSDVQDHYGFEGKLKPIPAGWFKDEQHRLVFDLAKSDADFTFRPYPSPLAGTISLETDRYTLRTRYSCQCAENSWQLYHPAGASFVCIEPLSSQDPKHPNLSVSALKIHLELL